MYEMISLASICGGTSGYGGLRGLSLFVKLQLQKRKEKPSGAMLLFLPRIF